MSRGRQRKAQLGREDVVRQHAIGAQLALAGYRRRRRAVMAGILMAAGALAGASPGLSQSAIRDDCLPHVALVQNLSFSHNKHRLWYQRFWTGKCQGLSTSLLGDACSESEPGWSVAVGDFMRQGPPARAQEILEKACKLGELVGYEWAKDNNVRCIHTMGSNSLSALKAILNEKGDMLDRLKRAEARARGMCTGLRAPPRK